MITEVNYENITEKLMKGEDVYCVYKMDFCICNMQDLKVSELRETLKDAKKNNTLYEFYQIESED